MCAIDTGRAIAARQQESSVPMGGELSHVSAGTFTSLLSLLAVEHFSEIWRGIKRREIASVSCVLFVLCNIVDMIQFNFASLSATVTVQGREVPFPLHRLAIADGGRRFTTGVQKG